MMRLTLEIEGHDKRYYQKDAPTVSDADYDALRQRFNAIERSFPDLVTGESPSQKVGAAPTGRFREGPARRADAVARQRLQRRGRDRIRRAHPALSQARCEQIPDFVAEPKIDGLSLSLRYEDGELVTRGDARRRFEGEDVTANVRTIEDVPQTLKGRNVPAVCEVRGEVYMTKKDFLALNKKQAEAGEPFSPIRAIRRRVRCARRIVAITASRPLKFFAYTWGEMSERPARHAVRHDAVDGARPASSINPLTKLCHTTSRTLLEVLPQDRGGPRQARLRHRRRRLQGRPARLAGAARLRVAQPALGDRA